MFVDIRWLEIATETTIFNPLRASKYRCALIMTSITPDLEPLYQVKLLAALRSGDPAVIHPFLQGISKDRRISGESKSGGEIDTGAAALHLAVRCASSQTVALLLGHRAISPNGIHPPGSGTTPLHLAASLGRVDIVNLLLEQENVDDSLRDANGKTCKGVARGKDVIKAIDDSRSFLTASYRSLLRSYILSPAADPPSPGLLNLLASPRIKHVDLSYLDDDSGLSLLHEAARRKDLRLIELAVRAGADVFVRDRKGKMAYEGVGGKDERVRVFLRQFANQDKTLLQTPLSPNELPPLLKGYLNKYTNLAKGYNTRWFVLKDGVLSYYRHQDDETVASRGSISMKTAVLRQTDRSRFEVHSIPLRGGQLRSNQQSQGSKWYMKASHPGEAHRWVEAIGKSIEYFKQREKEGGGESDSSSLMRRRSLESLSADNGLRMAITPSMSSSSGSNGGHKVVPGKSGVSGRDRDQESIVGSISGSYAPTLAEPASPVFLAEDQMSKKGISENEGDREDDDDDESSEDMEGGSKVDPPHPNVELQGNALMAQLEITNRLVENLLASSATSGATQTHQALTESLQTIQSLFSTFLDMTRERDEWHSRQLKGERKRQRVWEESLAVVVREGEGLEKELGKRRGRGASFLGGTQKQDEPKRRASIIGMMSGTVPPVPQKTDTSQELPTAVSAAHNPTTPPAIMKALPVAKSSTTDTLTPSISVHRPMAITVTSSPSRQQNETYEDDDHDTDEEDEFFDAIEMGNLPNLLVHEGLTSPLTSAALITPRASMVEISPPDSGTVGPADLRSLSLSKNISLPKGVIFQPYTGYTLPRSKLSITEDDRPSTSLWSVLKHSIGKDLTRISFPVFFNEPTSMLQRMAEDMEFSECLDVATHEKDPLRRIAFVAAFAMSNYSSTIGRIAKPFNPMLSETFEYVRLDKQYRYVSEQVSHHPPISACWCESPLWNYYGEVDAQNKFMGKSFEIRPTGIAHAELLLPEDQYPDYPRAKGEALKGKVVEHYSWKKVTTNVSGFILGSPTIDHYGDMVVTNHRTGDQCILTFKPRGWRGKDAYEISGQVIDSDDNVAYEIAGRWNSQLVARQVGAGNGQQLHPDVSVSSSSASPEYILLWRNSEKPAGSPFNLTPFAITLNDCPQDALRPFLCPTDCRLRVDQRAFELGKYELANELKQQQEEKQRRIRKAREEGKMRPHRPRWFLAETEPDTGDRVWSPVRVGDHKLGYWVEREKVWMEGGAEKTKWKDVEDIFVDELEELREMMVNISKA